jgi:hypothetical protein
MNFLLTEHPGMVSGYRSMPAAASRFSSGCSLFSLKKENKISINENIALENKNKYGTNLSIEACLGLSLKENCGDSASIETRGRYLSG